MATIVTGGAIGPGSPYTVRFPLPDLIVRGQANTIDVVVYRNGVAVAPSAGIVSVYSADGTAVVDTQLATVTGTRTHYTIAQIALPASLALEEGWRIEWTLVLADAAQPDLAVYPRNDAALIRKQIQPVITDGDLDQRMRGIDHLGRAPITAEHSQDAIDEAWIEINHRLINQGNRPNLIMSPSALRMPHLFLALAIRLDGLGPAFAERAMSFRRQYEAAWGSMSFTYDSDDDGEADSTERRGGTTSVWLG